MITGAHAIIYSRDAEADRAFFRDVIRLESVDAGGGWLIFALPTGELAIHPAEGNDRHELFLLCADIDAFVAAATGRGVACAPIAEEAWGRLTRIALPGGGRLGVYQPNHPQPPA